ncbi:signal recognition particle-docking protein FtsY [Pseudodesulfovibrio sp. F-1]|uniref:Signal recognition particle receptor FtsY n=1 Tax=Pseudodesulfovibrio alkaliphilus TaxID=2661613 RepID=A0A7K1KRT6_9BACT|nr:signal recognition particle-docking protein FtsY [Pseudodesulfovibrio alkaliphilus]MUM78816.1 signal recognition particle-docking protein FtsY [Pseudodesulfovibrio alkaliphilus]
MGFFSKLKKVWQSPEDIAQQALDDYKREHGLAAPEMASISENQAAVPETRPTADASLPGIETLPSNDGWRAGLTLALRQAEPKLSQWLTIITADVEEKGPLLWERLAFLFNALGAPDDEAREFISRFEAWLEDMGYRTVDDFRSELQYRLALALELEDEEDERDRLFLKLSDGIAKTREQITRRIDGLLSSHSRLDDDFWDEFEEILIMADVGMEAAGQLMDNLKARARKAGTDNPEDFKNILREELEEIFRTPPRIEAVNPPEVLMMVGVNGVGKTTTIAKLAYRAQLQGRKVLIAAGDTFRAAAIEQLEVWANRIGVGFFAKAEGSDPAAVAYEAMDKAVSEGYDLLLLDTAGRLHTKVNLMEELKKVQRVLGKKHPGAPHRCVLVIDATTGQNALSQTKLFNEAVGLDEIILTKLDGTAKGGVVVAVTLQHRLPITFVGLGEKMEDLRPFNGKDFAKALLT